MSKTLNHEVTQDLAPFLERCFLFDAVEDSYTISGITGEVPRWIRGTYYNNAPARFERAGARYRNWLDGDGMIYALSFAGNEIEFCNRFVRTRKWTEEEAAGRMIYRGFGTAFPGDKLRRGLMLEPPVNVSVYAYAHRLLAFGEQSLPVELDPVTLETRGDYDFLGSLNEVTPFAAHPKFEPATGVMVNFGISFSATQPALHVYEFEPTGKLARRKRYPIKYQHSNHDFGLSGNHAVFFLSPFLMNFQKFWNGASVMESLEWEPEKGSRILVAPRDSRVDAAFEVEVGSGYCLHMIHCFESKGTLYVDVLELDSPVYGEYQPMPDIFVNVTPGRPVRYRLDLDSRRLIDRVPMDYSYSLDFPSINNNLIGRPYEDFWFLGITATGRSGRKFFDQLAHANWRSGAVDDVYQAGSGKYFGGEPVYVPNPEDEEEGVVIIQQVDAVADRAEFLLFDAHQVARGPIARLPLRHKIHPGFHASFAAAAQPQSTPSFR